MVTNLQRKQAHQQQQSGAVSAPQHGGQSCVTQHSSQQRVHVVPDAPSTEHVHARVLLLHLFARRTTPRRLT
jgi:hypothetical protein